jgi:hypothetical protein
MIVVPFIWPTDSHDDEIRTGVQTEVVDWGLQKIGIFCKPFRKVQRGRERHNDGGRAEQRRDPIIMTGLVTIESQRRLITVGVDDTNISN